MSVASGENQRTPAMEVSSVVDVPASDADLVSHLTNSNHGTTSYMSIGLVM
jgi:hypothetical protein